ncbi:MAG: ankyrin repeat domain-containing protein [Planctomycetales bacterium]
MELNDFLDEDLANRGVVGGVVQVATEDGTHAVHVAYWYPEKPPRDLLEKLCEFTVGQLDDGIGEGGYEYPSKGGAGFCMPRPTVPSTSIFLTMGSRSPNSRSAIAARAGDLDTLQALLANPPYDLSRKYLGFPALHLAIINGHVDAVRMLLEAKAIPISWLFWGTLLWKAVQSQILCQMSKAERWHCCFSPREPIQTINRQTAKPLKATP